MRATCLFFILSLFLVTFCSASTTLKDNNLSLNLNNASQLTQKEKNFLNQNKKFTVCTQPDTYPISGLLNGTLVGIHGEVLNFVKDELGISYELILPKDNEELNQLVISRKCQIITDIVENQKRFKTIDSSYIITSFPYMSLGNINSFFFDNHLSFSKHKFLVRFPGIKSSIKKHYPNLNVIVVKDLDEIMKMVKSNKYYHFVAIKPFAEKTVQKYGFKDYKINGVFSNASLNLAIGVDSNLPLLLSAINKKITLIDNTFINNSIEKYSINEFTIKTSYEWLWYVLLGLVFIIFVLVYRFILETKQKVKLQEKITEELTAEKYALSKLNISALIHTKDRHIVWVNEKFASMLGYKEKELIGQETVIIYPNLEVYKYVGKRINEHLLEDNQVEGEIELKRKDGSLILCEYAIQLIEKIGNSSEFMTMLYDISDKRKKENELLESQMKWKFAVEGTGDGLWDWNVKTNEVFFSKQWKKMLGFEDNEIQGSLEEWEKRVHPDDLEKCYEDITNHMEGKTSKYENIHRVLYKDGTYKWILDRGIVLQRDENNLPIRMIGTHRDVHQRMEHEKLIQEQKEEFESIFRNSKDGIAILDLDTNFLDFNASFLEMTGFTKEELLTKSCIGLSSIDYIEESKKVYEEVRQKGYFNNFEKECIFKNDKRIVINLTANLLPDKKRILINVKNVSDLKLIENQLRNASMGEMIGNIAHQWRQPLNIISLNASTIKYLLNEEENIDKEGIFKITDKIVGQTKYLSETIDDFRNFIKDDKSFNYDVSINEVINSSIKLVESSIKDKHIQLITDINDDVKIYANKNELKQVFINIINNAQDFLLQRQDIQEDRFIFIHSLKIDENSLKVTITDTANGIENENLTKVFDPYFTTKHQSIGTGLGLSMAYKIITERHNQSISVHNEEFEYNNKKFKGACFTLIFKEEN